MEIEMTNTLIAFTASAAPARGYTFDAANEMLALFGDVLAGRATAETADRMLQITDAAVPVTASMRATMRQVRADDTADTFWKENAQRGDNIDTAEDGDGGELSITPAAGQQSKADRAARRVLREIVEGS